MDVALKHAQLAVPADRADLGDAQALLKEARHRLVPEIVEADACSRNSPTAVDQRLRQFLQDREACCIRRDGRQCSWERPG